MLTLYNYSSYKSISQMTLDELKRRYHVPENIQLRYDVVKYIRNIILTIGSIPTTKNKYHMY